MNVSGNTVLNLKELRSIHLLVVPVDGLVRILPCPLDLTILLKKPCKDGMMENSLIITSRLVSKLTNPK